MQWGILIQWSPGLGYSTESTWFETGSLFHVILNHKMINAVLLPDMCSGLLENVPYRLTYLNTWSQVVGAVWEVWPCWREYVAGAGVGRFESVKS